MIMLWLLLGRLLALGTTGYLYSRHTRTFVGRQGLLLSMHAAPLPFTIRTRGGGVRLTGHSGGRAFRVTHVGGAASSQFRIEMNKAGEIRVRNGRLCETVSGGFLKDQKCRNSARQRFIWVPAALFRREAQRGDGGRTDGRRHQGGQQTPPARENGAGHGPSPEMLVKYAGIFCSKHPAAQECVEYRRYIDSRRARGGQESGSSTEETESTESSPAANPQTARPPAFDAAAAGYQTAAAPVQNTSRGGRKRVRGVYARGIDSTDSADCTAKCIVNPRNNECYYQLDSRGNLKPLLDTTRCSSSKRFCDLPNPLDRFFCEVAFENNYSFFSKLLD